MSVVAVRGSSGFTLPEMLCALVLGSVLLLGVSVWLAQLREAAVAQSQRVRLQLQAQHAAALLRHDLQAFAGPVQQMLPPAVTLTGDLACDQAWLFQLDPPVVHWRFASAASLPPCVRVGNIVPDTDVVLLRLLGEPVLSENAEPGKLYLWLDEEGAGRWLEGSQRSEAGAAVLWPLQLIQWYLRSYAVDPGDGLPTLCRRQPTRQVLPPRMGASECLVEGVENLRLQLSQSPFDEAQSRSATHALHLGALLRSPLPVPGADRAQRYRLLDQELSTPADRHLRSVVHLTRPLHRWVEVFEHDE